MTRLSNSTIHSFNAFVVAARNASLKEFTAKGYDDAEDMAQEVAMQLAGQRSDLCRSNDWQTAPNLVTAGAMARIEANARSRKRGMKLMDLEKAVSVPDVSTPYHFLIAQEIVGVAESLDLDSVMMGDTLSDESDHYGVTKQRAHQIVNGLRDQMAEYLIK